MKQIKKMIVSALLIAILGYFNIPSSFAAIKCPDGSNRKEAETLAQCNVPEDNSLMPTISTLLSVMVGILGVVAVIVIIYGGSQYVLSAGETNKIKKAKDTILYGIVGLVISFLAFAIVSFVISAIK